MKTAMLRSAGAALRRNAASSAPASRLVSRSYSSESQPERKVAILGAAGGIGQPLALLMKLNPLVSTLSLYDIANTPGVAADVSHINSKAQVLSPVFLHSQFLRSLISTYCFGLVWLLTSFWLIWI